MRESIVSEPNSIVSVRVSASDSVSWTTGSASAGRRPERKAAEAAERTMAAEAAVLRVLAMGLGLGLGFEEDEALKDEILEGLGFRVRVLIGGRNGEMRRFSKWMGVDEVKESMDGVLSFKIRARVLEEKGGNGRGFDFGFCWIYLFIFIFI